MNLTALPVNQAYKPVPLHEGTDDDDYPRVGFLQPQFPRGLPNNQTQLDIFCPYKAENEQWGNSSASKRASVLFAGRESPWIRDSRF